MIRNIKTPSCCERTSIVHRASGEPTAPHERVIGTNDRRQLNSDRTTGQFTPLSASAGETFELSLGMRAPQRRRTEADGGRGAMVCPPPPGRTQPRTSAQESRLPDPRPVAAACAAPLRLRLRSSSTREHKKKKTKETAVNPLPNPYSHNPWYRNRGIPGVVAPK